MKFTGSSRLCALAALALVVVSAQAGTVTTYTGSDDGASTSGPFPGSNAAASAFLAAAGAFGATTTMTFDTVPYFGTAGVTVNYTTPFTCPFGGVCSLVYGNLYGFPISGSNFFAFDDGTATFSFASGTNSFGFYSTGLQTVFTTAVTVSFNDGAPEVVNFLPNVNGGAQYMGLTDTSIFSSITISDPGNDAWAIDNASFNSQNVSATPEPSSLVLLGTGLVGAFGAVRRRFSK